MTLPESITSATTGHRGFHSSLHLPYNDYFHAADYGTLDNTGVLAANSIIQQAVNAASTAYLADGKPRTVYLRAGHYRLTSPIAWKSGVSLQGAGSRRTILFPEGINAAIKESTSHTVGAPMYDCQFRDFGIDGVNQTGPYATGIKGIFCKFMVRPVFMNLWIKDTYASSLGVDYLIDGLFLNCYIENPGRGYLGSGSGASGIGIATGESAVESTTIIGCTIKGGLNFGIFFERAGTATFQSKYHRVVGNHISTCRVGVGDVGSDGLIVTGNTIVSNTGHGFLSDDDGLSDRGGMNGVFADNVVRSNGGSGVYLGNAAHRYDVKNNQIMDNTAYGVLAYRASSETAGANITIEGNRIRANGASGIGVDGVAGSTFPRLTIKGNRITNNVADGITIVRDTTDLLIEGNDCFDDQGVKTQVNGIKLSASRTHTDPIIVRNRVRGNLTAGYDPTTATITNGIVADNYGYSPA